MAEDSAQRNLSLRQPSQIQGLLPAAQKKPLAMGTKKPCFVLEVGCNPLRCRAPGGVYNPVHNQNIINVFGF